MRLHRSGSGVVVQAPAKLNLFFEVLRKREDGYHEIETLMCPIDLYDTLYFREEPSGQIDFRCEAAGLPHRPDRSWLSQLPQGSENLVVRAVETLRRRTGVQSGASIRLVKRIPTAAGLGGGSSDAAAALVAADALWGTNCSPGDLAAMAAELGSDVPFFLGRGAAICRGRGEQVEAVPGFGTLHFVVVRPPEGLATAAVYKACRPASEPRSVAPLLDALFRGNLSEIGGQLLNRLEGVAETMSPWIGRLRDELARLDCVGHQMSGSGTSYFGLCRHARHARRVARRLQARGAGSVFAVQSCP